MTQGVAMNHWMFVLVGALIIAGIPLAMRKVPLNSFYGFRVPKAMRSPEMWLDANEKAGINMIAAGLFTFVAWGVMRLVWGSVILHAVGGDVMAGSFLIALLVSFVQLHRM